MPRSAPAIFLARKRTPVPQRGEDSFDARFAAREALVLLGKSQQLTEEQSQQVVENLRLAKEQSEGSDRERIDDMIKRTLQKTGATAKTKSAAKTP
jgi:hypothetical protein